MTISYTTSNTCLSTLKLLGDYWTLRIIDALRDGEMRFCEVQRRVDNLNPVTLTDRLKKLEDAQMLIRKEDTLGKVSVSYTLSDKGTECIPVIEAINTFAAKANS